MLRRRLLVSAVAAVGALGVVGGVVATHRSSAPVHQTTENSVSLVQLPGYDGLTADQKLDRALSLPGMRGVVEGQLGMPVTHSVYLPDKGVEEFVKRNPRLAPQLQQLEHPTVIDVPMVVTAVYGTSNAPYAVGATVTLRLPVDGTPNVDASNIPSVGAGESVFVFVRDQGIVMGGNTASILVASSDADVIRVRDGVARGVGFEEAVASFVQHFRAHPVPS